MKKNWWKVLCVILLMYTIIGGFLMPVPALYILHETIRNIYFHVSMWFAMMVVLVVSCINAIRYLAHPGTMKYDIISAEAAYVGLLFGALGLITGSIWAKNTWGQYWSNDPKELCALIAWLVYLAYVVLRNSVVDLDKRARISAVYNVFAFVLLFPFLFVIPRLTDSLHPGNGGNPGFSAYDVDNNIRKVLYAAWIGWSLLAVWILELRIRIRQIEIKQIFHE
ncbi:MAG TPA: cytochrome c biogenesis protein CcsA [Chitinophagaceae bacterium]|nr:cytochrome c biogenesis protein CcsA [Chitinophagaceae bacterium]